MPAEQAAEPKKRCFVVMGFGIKTDFATGRQLDLNKSYRLLIKPVIVQKGIECVRADEIRHSGTIDVPMYEAVVADLSTANPNALYELGIRHALKPRTTIVISENKLTYPFDLNHTVIMKYTHLGDAIDFDEVERFRGELSQMLDDVLRAQKTDSPVYTFLAALKPPALSQATLEKIEIAEETTKDAARAVAKETTRAQRPPAKPKEKSTEPTLAVLISQGEEAIRAGDFHRARDLFAAAVEVEKVMMPDGSFKHDQYLVQRLALATYKTKPETVAGLQKGLDILKQLNPHESNDPETVGLAGAIEKRLFESGQGAEHLGFAIGYYGRGFYLRNDWYNGINLAYLLNVRTDSSLDQTPEERVADLVWANRIRREVIGLCDDQLETIRKASATVEQLDGKRPESEVATDRAQKFWCLATKAEAHFGLAEFDAYTKTRSDAEKVQIADWMIGTFDEQIRKLTALLDEHGHLLNPPWPRDRAAQALPAATS
jgi:hypothetical protein